MAADRLGAPVQIFTNFGQPKAHLPYQMAYEAHTGIRLVQALAEPGIPELARLRRPDLDRPEPEAQQWDAELLGPQLGAPQYRPR